MSQQLNQQKILDSVRDQYAAVARSSLSNDSAAIRSVAAAFGYSPEDLASLPSQSNMGLSCGNPVAVAGLREGEVVVDLGCGGGLDVILASKRIGPAGKAIGIDMTQDMIDRAKASAAKVGATNVEFHLAQIDQLPLPDNSVDCVISNCVINLVPDKPRVLREILRVLKPGGRLVVSDIALKQPLPAEIVSDVNAYVGCISGAIAIDDYASLLEAAGFDSIVVQDTGADLNVYAQAGSTCTSPNCCTPATASPVHAGLSSVLERFNANEYAASVRVHALKPGVSSPQDTLSNRPVIQVFDKPMCCATGVCGPQVDPVLPRFAGDLDWLKAQGYTVERYNLAQQPQTFVENAMVIEQISKHGTECLPLILVDGKVVSSADYPSREMLLKALRGTSYLPVVVAGCCGGAPQKLSSACCAKDEQALQTSGNGCGCTSECC